MNESISHDSINVISRLGDKIKAFDGATILITGCFGFLGKQFLYFFSNLIDLHNLNIKVVAIDNLIRERENSSVNYFSNKNYLTFIESDINTQKQFYDADYVIHLASIASPIFYRKYPIQTLDANVTGYRNLLDYYKNRKIKVFVFLRVKFMVILSKSSFQRKNISWKCIRTELTCYDESKRLGETMSYCFSRI